MDFFKLVQYIEPKRVVDIGAHVGDFTKQLASMSPNCEFILVEANPYCEEYLKKLNQPYKILALSNQVGTTHLYVEKANSIGTGASLYRENTEWYGEGKYELVEVPVDTLDNQNFFPEEVIDIVKMDVQGAELDILKGGMRTIKKAECLLLEMQMKEYNIGAPMAQDVIIYLADHGFEFIDIFDLMYSNNQLIQIDGFFRNKNYEA